MSKLQASKLYKTLYFYLSLHLSDMVDWVRIPPLGIARGGCCVLATTADLCELTFKAVVSQL